MSSEPSTDGYDLLDRPMWMTRQMSGPAISLGSITMTAAAARSISATTITPG